MLPFVSQPFRACALGLMAWGCSATPYGATVANLEQAHQRASLGGKLYDRECAGCHGGRGEGLASSPAIMGPGALPAHPRAHSAASTDEQTRQKGQTTSDTPTGRGQFETAQDLYDFVGTHMPRLSQSKTHLSADEYWVILDYLLMAHGSEVPAAGLHPDNAKSVLLSSR
jgi:hypothetical protein